MPLGIYFQYALTSHNCSGHLQECQSLGNVRFVSVSAGGAVLETIGTPSRLHPFGFFLLDPPGGSR